MPEASNRERDLVLAPNEFALISDQTKGHIVVYVGPCKTSLANTDQPVVFNDRTKRFERCNLEQSISIFSTAPEGWYLNLKNPAKDSHQPRTFGPNNLPELNIGRKVNIPGPVSFSLWPGQMVRIIQGHHLRSNQYLVVRVYDEEAAKANWKKAVIKPQTPAPSDGVTPGTAPAIPPVPSDPKSGAVDPASDVPELTMGKQLVIKGTDVSFYIPPTGIEVVRDARDTYVREAVTLERLEYCILLDEDGNKRYIQGPAVVFPRPTEAFVEKNGSRKFKAIELNEISGLYIKVIAPYKGEDGVEHKVGEELFITGKNQMIYFPRPEHAIIKYGEQEIHYAVAIPAGEGRYFLNRNTGKVTLKRGPCMFLPDPRQEVIVRRILEPKQCALWFPGNQEALEYNVRLKNIAKAQHADAYLPDGEARTKLPSPAPVPVRPGSPIAPTAEPLAEGHAGDDFTRKRGFTQPRTITLDTKYEGAVAIDIWTGYAVLVVGRAGERRVIAGPQTYLLEYDEALESLELSTGTPKSDDNKIKTAYLRVLHNKVSDVIEAETNDLCRVRLKLSYRVNFEGDSSRWFNVENYVKFLTDHMRSLVRHAVKQHRIEEFYATAIRVIRDTILGSSGADSKRAGRSFAENGMHIYDVEVLDVKIGDEAIEKLLIDAQHSVVKQTLEIASQKRQLEFTQQNETIRQQIAEAQSRTKQQEFELLTLEAKSQLLLNLAKIESETESRKRTLDAKLSDQATLGKIDSAELSRKKEAYDLELEITRRRLALKLEEIKTETEAVIGKAGAVSPKLIAAMQAFSDKALAERMAHSMAPLAILGGRSVADVFSQLLKGTVLEGVLKSASESEQ